MLFWSLISLPRAEPAAGGGSVRVTRRMSSNGCQSKIGKLIKNASKILEEPSPRLLPGLKSNKSGPLSGFVRAPPDPREVNWILFYRD